MPNAPMCPTFPSASPRFGRGRRLLLFTDDLSRDPQGVLQRVCRFLGVDPDFPFGALRERYNRRERYFSETPKLWNRLRRFDLVQRLLGKLAPSTREKLRRLLSRRIEIGR